MHGERFTAARGRCVCIWTGNPADLYDGSESYSMCNGNFAVYNGNVFFLRSDGSVPGRTARHGIFRSADDPVRDRNGRNSNRMDLRHFPDTQITFSFIYFLSGVLDSDDHHAGDLLLFRTETCASDAQRYGEPDRSIEKNVFFR